MTAKPSCIHRNLSVFHVKDHHVMAMIKNDKTISALLLKDTEDGFLFVLRQNEEKVMQRLELLGQSIKPLGRWVS